MWKIVFDQNWKLYYNEQLFMLKYRIEECWVSENVFYNLITWCEFCECRNHQNMFTAYKSLQLDVLTSYLW